MCKCHGYRWFLRICIYTLIFMSTKFPGKINISKQRRCIDENIDLRRYLIGNRFHDPWRVCEQVKQLTIAYKSWSYCWRTLYSLSLIHQLFVFHICSLPTRGSDIPSLKMSMIFTYPYWNIYSLFIQFRFCPTAIFSFTIFRLFHFWWKRKEKWYFRRNLDMHLE